MTEESLPVMEQVLPADHERVRHHSCDDLLGRSGAANRVSANLAQRAVTARRHRARLLGEMEERRQEARTRMDALRQLRREAAALGPAQPPTPLWTSRRRPSERELPRRDEWPDTLPELHLRYAATRCPAVEERLMAVYDGFALAIARRIASRRERREDMGQVARLALLLALRRFDPDRGRPFPVFARLTIEGELKRHVRDRTWSMRVSRGAQERYLAVIRADDDLRLELGRPPRIREIAAYLSLSDEQVLGSMELANDQHVLSLDAPTAGTDGVSLDPGVIDASFSSVENRAVLDSLLRRLSEREREVLRLRFSEELTQSQIGVRLGVSQMYVSRVLTRTLARLRVWAGAGPAAVPAPTTG
jgi:RNA polymerase sigma-B factor